MRSGTATAIGLLAGVGIDRLVGDPVRAHPVALLGQAATRLEQRLYRDRRRAGVLHLLLVVVAPTAATVAAQRRAGPLARTVLTTAAVAAALGGRTLRTTALEMDRHLAAGDLEQARRRLPSLCGRAPDGLDGDALARATIESVAENTVDAVVATLWWTAVAGPAGAVAHRAVNTLDAMVGHRSPRYERFGWAAARTDDVLGTVPARLSAALTVLLAPAAGGSATGAWRAWQRDAVAHPSPNAGVAEAAMAGALGVRLGGGTAHYAGHDRRQPAMGAGRAPTPEDIARAVSLARRVWAATALLAAVATAAWPREARR